MKRADVITWLEARARQEDGCLVWTMAINSNGHPVASVDGVRARNVRRWLHEQLVGPIDVPLKLVPTCRNLRCVERRHFALLLPGQVNDLLVAEGRYDTPARLAASQKAGRTNSRNTMADARRAREMRADGATLSEISVAVGFSVSVASRVCRGEVWRQVSRAASAFEWRGGAAS